MSRRLDQRSDAAKIYRKWYNTARWRVARAAQLLKQPLCERCLSHGVVRAATVVHHTEAHKGDADLFWDASKYASSCDPCHNVDEQRIERGGKARQIVDADGWPA